MAFYDYGRGTQLGAKLGRITDALQTVLDEGAAVADELNQMSDAQIAANAGVSAIEGGNTAVQQAAALKAEFLSDVGKLLTNNSQTNVYAALRQLLAQTG